MVYEERLMEIPAILNYRNVFIENLGVRERKYKQIPYCDGGNSLIPESGMPEGTDVGLLRSWVEDRR